MLSPTVLQHVNIHTKQYDEEMNPFKGGCQGVCVCVSGGGEAWVPLLPLSYARYCNQIFLLPLTSPTNFVSEVSPTPFPIQSLRYDERLFGQPAHGTALTRMASLSMDVNFTQQKE